MLDPARPVPDVVAALRQELYAVHDEVELEWCAEGFDMDVLAERLARVVDPMIDRIGWVADHPFRSIYVSDRHERCLCGADVAHKIEEVIFADDPQQMRHPLTSYVCCRCFARVMGYGARSCLEGH